MRQAIILFLVCLGLGAGNARAAGLIGEDILVRLDVEGAPFRTVTVGAGPEISGLASPLGYPWVWTVDFGASDFTITAVTTEIIADGSLPGIFSPAISFASSSTPGLIPFDPGLLTLTEQIARDGETGADIAGRFDGPLPASVGPFNGYRFSLRASPSRSEEFPAGSFVQWSGTIDLANTTRVPLPASAALLLAGLAALGLVRGRRRA